MAYPRELTIATGTTVYTGDPDSDERIQSREVRVSVTYELDAEDTDVPLLAAVKAAEVEQAHRAVRQQVGTRRPYGEAEQTRTEIHHEETTRDGPPPAPPAEPDPPPLPQFGQGYRRVTSPGYGPSAAGANGHPYGNGNTSTNGASVPAGTPTGTAVDPPEELATKPQQLSIKSHCKRLGLGDTDLTALLRQQFGKFRLERLTREEATRLMRAFERGECETDGADAALSVH